MTGHYIIVESRGKATLKPFEVPQPKAGEVLLENDYTVVSAGTERAMRETFGSSCHGAGRVMSRSRAKKEARGRDLRSELDEMGVRVMASGRSTLAEEMPQAYKDVASVVDVVDRAGIATKVARLKPLGVIKG